MDKQIIIDVCPYQGECSVSGCKRNDDGCFVRQLFEERYRAENQIVELNKTIKAKEQECEELKKIIERLDVPKHEVIDMDIALENEELRTENEELIAKYNDCHCVTTNYHICFEGALGAIQELVKSEKTKEQVEYYTNVALNYLSMRYDERKKVPNKYKQALTEIKEIAENREIFCENCGGGVESFTCNDCGYIKILQKTKEVMPDEN